MPKGRPGAGVSSGSFLDLKAEVSKKVDEFEKSKARGNGKAEPIVGGVKRDDKKTPSWMKKNKGVASRAARDEVEFEAVSQQTVESARAALERKSKIYDKLQKGLTGGLNDKQYDNLLVDFDKKAEEGGYPSDSDEEEDVDESATVPGVLEDDPMVEYQDEFGRTRTARRSEVPRDLVREPEVEKERPEDDPHLIYNPVGYFPTYEPSAERLQAIQDDLAESLKEPTQHYDASKENRAKGAGFYQFSADEETRRKQMEELKASRVETEEKREEMGAGVAKPVNRAAEKRKRELEERRKLIEAKKRKLSEGKAKNGTPEEAGIQRGSDPVAGPSTGHSADLP